jgi:diadenylate cyclase
MMHYLDWLTTIGFTGSLDILIMSLLIYSVLVWFKKTKAAFVLTGILIIAGVYLVARELNLYLTAQVFQAFFAVILVAMIVIFQEELRQFFEQVAVWSLSRQQKESVHLTRPEVEVLVNAVTDLSRNKIGALIVIRGRDLIMRHLVGGVELDGRVSEPLLKSIFDPHSIGHDGAVVIDRGRISRFSCQLPLSKNGCGSGPAGTRHAAALGVAELTDALCVVVSEERGSISVAHEGKIEEIADSAALKKMIELFYHDITPRQPGRNAWQDFFKKNSREKVIALGMAMALWFVVVHGSKPVYKVYTVPVKYSVLPSSLEVKAVSPKEVDVKLSGPRRAFYFFSADKIKLFLKLWNLESGFHKIKINRADLSFPKPLILEGIEPPAVRVCLEESPKNTPDTEAETETPIE